jgi:hypothetical protein
MALVGSSVKSEKEGRSVADRKIQKEDLVVENNVGQRVVLVPAGQPVPDDAELEARRAAAGVTVNATDDQIDAARNAQGGVVTAAPSASKAKK